MPTFIQPSFAKGELAPALHGRVDTAVYQVGVRKARNVNIHQYGGLSNRPGTVFIGPVKDYANPPILVDFQFKASDTYMLEFGHQYMRVVRNDSHVLESDTATSKSALPGPGAILDVDTSSVPVKVVVLLGSTVSPFVVGEQVYIDGLTTTTELNGRLFTVSSVTAYNPTAGANRSDTLELEHYVTGEDIDATGYTAYGSFGDNGGQMHRLYEITTPYAVADLPELKYVQTADKVTITHPSYPMMELTRSDHDQFVLAEPVYGPSVFFSQLITAVVNTAGSVTQRYKVTGVLDNGEETLSGIGATQGVSSAVALDDDTIRFTLTSAVGSGYEVNQTARVANVGGPLNKMTVRDLKITAVSGSDITLASKGLGTLLAGSDISVGRVEASYRRVPSATATPNITLSWSGVGIESRIVRFAVYREDNGVYGFIGETELPTFKDANITPDLAISPARGDFPFEEVESYPGATSFYEQRRVVGGSLEAPDTHIYSRIGNSSNFNISRPLQDDDSITATLAARQINDIRHFVPMNDLLVFTSGSIWRVNSGGDAAFTPSSLNQKQQSAWGAGHQRPIVSGNSILFVEDNNIRVRSLGYSFQIDGYTGSDLTILAHHMLEIYPVVAWSYSYSPESRAHLVRADGKALTMTFDPEQEVIAWTTWDTLGKFTWTASTRRSTSATEDGVFFVVKRNINGHNVHFIERVASRRFTDVRDCFFVDCGLTYDNPVAITGITATNPVVVTAPAHGVSNGDLVDLSDIEWEPVFDDLDNETQPPQLNDSRFLAQNVTTDTLELAYADGSGAVDGSSFLGYVDGGNVRKAVTTVSGYHHLEGVTGVALVDGNVETGLTITNGDLVLPYPASRIHYGLKFISDVELLNVEAPTGTIQGKLKRIPSTILRVEKTRGLFIGTSFERMTEMKQRKNELYGNPTALFTGDHTQSMPSGWDTNGRVAMRQRYPLPFTLLAVIPNLEVGGDK